MSGFVIPSTEEIGKLAKETQANMAAAYLAGLEPGRYPLSLFEQLSRLAVMSTVELVPLRRNKETGRTEVLLTQRPESDPWWGRQWHVAGSVILPNDEVTHDSEIDFDSTDFNPTSSYDSIINRLIQNEFKGSIEVGDGPHLYNARYRRGIRGPESTVMFWAGVDVKDVKDGDLPIGTFFDTETIAQDPPEGGLIVGHANSIKLATAAYLAAQ